MLKGGMGGKLVVDISPPKEQLIERTSYAC